MTARQSVRVAAVDLGATSGRVMAGRVGGGRVEIDELHRFPNGAVQLPGALVWDAVGIYREVMTGIREVAATGPLDGIGIDSWAVDHGLVERAPGESDRRVSVVRLTPDGRRAYRKIVELRIRIMDEVLAEWPVAERELLAALVERLVDDLATRGARGARAAQAGAA